MKQFLLKRRLLFLISCFVFLADQSSKSTIINLLSDKAFIPLVPHILHLRLVRNTGAAFSLFDNSTPILSLLSLFVSIGLIAWIYHRNRFNLWKGLGLSLLLGGCIGNGIDRWRLGYVNDFIELIPINFAIFNFADIAINIAVICLIIDNFREQKSQSLS